jgi:hypothetical protein
MHDVLVTAAARRVDLRQQPHHAVRTPPQADRVPARAGNAGAAAVSEASPQLLSSIAICNRIARLRHAAFVAAHTRAQDAGARVGTTMRQSDRECRELLFKEELALRMGQIKTLERKLERLKQRGPACTGQLKGTP